MTARQSKVCLVREEGRKREKVVERWGTCRTARGAGDGAAVARVLGAVCRAISGQSEPAGASDGERRTTTKRFGTMNANKQNAASCYCDSARENLTVCFK